MKLYFHFSLHKDDKAVGNKTLETVIKEAADKEIIDIYGDKFIEKVLTDDPLVCIKIPDIFYNFDWETEEYAPMVGVSTPMGIDPSGHVLVGFHYSGYMDYYFKGEDYFSIIVKYSED